MRLRQAVWVARDLDSVAGELESATGVKDPYNDPGVAAFGLRNAVYAIGDTFLEIVSPTQEGTTAGRYLERRGGDGGYMVIIQVDDIEKARARLEQLGVRTVWSTDLDDISATHLHPKDIGGAIVSIDQPKPPESWRWAGEGWTARAVPGALHAVELQSDEPAKLATRWGEVLGRPVKGNSIELDQGTIRFVQATNERGDGLAGIDLKIPNARDEATNIGGVRLSILS